MIRRTYVDFPEDLDGFSDFLSSDQANSSFALFFSLFISAIACLVDSSLSDNMRRVERIRGETILTLYPTCLRLL